MTSDAKRSPKSRGVADLTQRIQRLEKYEKWRVPQRVDFETLVGSELYSQHWANWQQLLALMDSAQQLAIRLKSAATTALAKEPVHDTCEGTNV